MDTFQIEKSLNIEKSVEKLRVRQGMGFRVNKPFGIGSFLYFYKIDVRMSLKANTKLEKVGGILTVYIK